jgi:hypothetical protein
MTNHELAKDFYARFAHRCMTLITTSIVGNAVIARQHFGENVIVHTTTIAGSYVMTGIYVWIRGCAKKS